ncbi:MAG: hypothetical protein HYR96_14980 [Deltaproteobacteria bacterium]|nr:hypothetical protein [Deltaproteobacteria bacterium]MBI3293674.1 hypothetical protein [Deltaproteobacteria bacterium]
MKLYSLKVTTLLTVSTLLTGCGLQFGFPVPTLLTTSTALKDGYYVAKEVTLASVHFPLVVIKTSGSQQNVFQVSTVNSPASFAFGRGYSTSQAATAMATLAIATSGGDYVGSIQASAAGLHLQSRLMNSSDESSSSFPLTGTVVSGQDYTMNLTDLNRFLKQLRLLVTPAVGTVFTATQDSDCNAAFGMNCTSAYFSALP